MVRPPEGEWVCLKARTTIGGGAIGLAASKVYDERGLVARSAQTCSSRLADAGTSYELVVWAGRLGSQFV